MRRLEFLPYHFLLTSIGEGGILRYQARATAGTCSACIVHILRHVAGAYSTRLLHLQLLS